MLEKYVLIGQTPVLCDDVLEWARGFDVNNRRVAWTEFAFGFVSTVFLGIDHSWGNSEEPLLFETMVFWGGDDGEEQDRCSTWMQAEAMHRDMVSYVMTPRVVWAYVLRTVVTTVKQMWKELRAVPTVREDP